MALVLNQLARPFFDTIWKLQVLSKFPAPASTSNLQIVTGADSSHFLALANLLHSIDTFEPHIHVTIWDLGLSSTERLDIETKFPRFIFKDFPYGSVPSYFNIAVDAGQYAWKPVAIENSKNDLYPLILWLDAGNLLKSDLSLVGGIISKQGFFSPYSSGKIKDWTHPKTLSFLQADEAISEGPNCNGAIVGFDCENPLALALLASWVSCALNKDCIAPKGSNRDNHRQDQAALSVLAEQHNLNDRGFERELRKPLGILIHQDPKQQ
jgi:hypothetical protein